MATESLPIKDSEAKIIKKPWAKTWAKKSKGQDGRFGALGDRPMAEKQLQTRLPQDLDDQVRAMAAERGEGVSGVLRELVELGLSLDQDLLDQCPSVEWINEAIAQRLRRRKS